MVSHILGYTFTLKLANKKPHSLSICFAIIVVVRNLTFLFNFNREISLVEDLARVRDVLRANAVDKTVDEEVVIDMLELYAGDNRRVDLVIFDLEKMLGKELSVYTQHQR